MYKFKFKFLVLSTVLLAVIASIPAYSQLNPIKFVKDELPNGMEVIYNIDKSAPVIATVVHYRVGSRDEITGKTGYAHLFEHLMFEATANIPRATIDKNILEAGGYLNAHTSIDETVYFFQLPSNQIKLALWMESQRMRQLKVDSIGVETQRGVVIEELKQRTENQPYGSLIMKIQENLFKGSNYSWATIGYKADLEKASIYDFKDFYDNYYQPNNVTLVISGDFDLKEAREYVKQYFGNMPKSNGPKRPKFDLPTMTSKYEEDIEDTKAQVPASIYAFRGPKIGDNDYYALNILTDVLASGESSRLYQRLVDKEQAALAAQLIPFNLQYAGAMIFFVVPNQGKKIKDVEELMFEELEKVCKEGITEKELEKAKNIKEAQFVFGKKNTLEKASELARYNSYFGDPALINTEIDKYLAVSKDDVIRVAKKYFGTDKYVHLRYLPTGYKD